VPAAALQASTLFDCFDTLRYLKRSTCLAGYILLAVLQEMRLEARKRYATPYNNISSNFSIFIPLLISVRQAVTCFLLSRSLFTFIFLFSFFLTITLSFSFLSSPLSLSLPLFLSSLCVHRDSPTMRFHVYHITSLNSCILCRILFNNFRMRDLT
jgi:hypothetical protein